MPGLRITTGEQGNVMKKPINRHFLRESKIEIGDQGCLSNQETRTTFYVAEGYTTAETAEQMGIAERTVIDYADKAMTKTNSRNRAHLVRNAFTLGILREASNQRGAVAVTALWLMILLTLSTLVLDHTLVRARTRPSKVRSSQTYRLNRSGGRARRELEAVEAWFETWGTDS